jgi:localization factor PodJL
VRGEEQNNKRVMERVKANDPAALTQMGIIRGKEGDYETALEYFKEAAELGDASVHYRLGGMYHRGEGVEKDLEKGIHHFEKAAICGNPDARHYLAIIEGGENRNFERMVKHLIIAAKLGHDESMKALGKIYSAGNITKEEVDDTLRGHQAAIDATKSAQRDAALSYYRRMSGLPHDGGESTYIPPASPQSVSAAVMQGLYNNESNEYN